MSELMKLKSRICNLELFMIEVCKRLKVLPDFFDSLPDKGNAHAIKKLDALLKLEEEKLNSTPSAEQQRKDLIPLLTDAVFLLKGDCCSYQDRDEALSKLNAALAELKSISS